MCLMKNGDEMRLAICVATRGRADSMIILLDRLECLSSPVDVELFVVVIENDDSSNLREEVLRRSSENRQFIHGLQPKLGIPYARNSALRVAIEEKADYIAFLDDDELPSEDWLIALWEKAKNNSYDLVGGPVEPMPAVSATSWASKQMLLGLLRQSQLSRRKALSKCASGQENDIFIPTSNWMARSAFMLQHRLEFDESMGFSGGTDLRFYRELKRAGGRIGWCDTALVRERLSAKRLSVGYQYRRARDQATSNFQVKNPRVTPKIVVKGIFYCAGKFFSALVLLPFVPMSKEGGFYQMIRSLGQSVGRFKALLGRKSDHYQRIV